MSSSAPIIIRIDRQAWRQTRVMLPTLLILLSLLGLGIGDSLNRTLAPAQAEAEAEVVSARPADYPTRGADLNPALYSLELPPPPLDALPYDVRSPLSNGDSVPVKKRWLWVPEGQAIRVTADRFEIPVGTTWWKEFYVETDRGTFLMERRILQRVAVTPRNPEGWAFFSSHHLPEQAGSDPLVFDSVGEEASRFAFAPTDWLPTQPRFEPLEVRFRDVRGVEYGYVFPGAVQCTVCHAGATGAYPNAEPDWVMAFGLHPNNLTPDSFTALVARGWLVGAGAPLAEAQPVGEGASFEQLTLELNAVLRNNCASCHNSASVAAASYSAFILDPNKAYTPDELVALLSVQGVMVEGAHPLVTPGDLANSEVWLRLNGLDGRRRMPPAEGGLAHPDPDLLALWEAWIMAAATP
jgi:hypothetical protein